MPVFDRELSLSGNAIGHDTGMFGYLNVNGALLPAAAPWARRSCIADTYNSVVPGQTLTVSDPSKGVIANDTNVYGVQVRGDAPAGLTLNADGTFTYTGAPTTFTYCANGTVTGTTCSSGITATVTVGAAPIEAAGGITCIEPHYLHLQRRQPISRSRPPAFWRLQRRGGLSADG